MPKFEWDKNKNKKNTLKHKVNFEEAKTFLMIPIEFKASRNNKLVSPLDFLDIEEELIKKT